MYAWQKAVLFWSVQSNVICFFCDQKCVCWPKCVQETPPAPQPSLGVERDLSPDLQVHIPPLSLAMHHLMFNRFISITYFWQDCVSCNVLLTLLALSSCVNSLSIGPGSVKSLLVNTYGKAFIWAVYGLSYAPVKLMPVIQKCTP